MIAHGRVRNGVVVLDDGFHLPEGQEVTIVGLETAAAPPSPQGSPSHSILDIPVVSLGAMLQPQMADDDILGEMLEGRR
jgi:hypothetical protein